MLKNHGGLRPGAGRRKGSGKYGTVTKAIRIPAHLEQDVIKLIQTRKTSIPLYTTKISAGYPLPCDDSISEELNLDEYLIKHPSATFLVRANGDSMTGAGIYDNDVLVVDRSLNAVHGSIVVAAVDGQLTVKRLFKQSKKCLLMPENPRFSPINISDNCETVIWGVVTYVLHDVQK